MKKILLSVLGLLWVALCLNGQNDIVPVKHFDRYNGLPAKRLFAMCRDNDGFIWLGAENGVFRFDGRTFYQYTTHEGLCDNEILSIFSDSKSRIWCGGYNGKISVIENGVINNSLPFVQNWNSRGMVRDFMEDAKGNIYLSCEQSQAFCISPAGQVLDLGMDSAKIMGRRIFIHDGHIFVNDIYDLYRFDGVGKFINISNQKVRSSHTGVFISEDYDAAWKMNVEEGIHENLYTGQKIYMKEHADPVVFFITQLDSRLVLLSLYGQGVFLYDLEKGTFREIDLPLDATVSESLLDGQGNLWMITPLHGLYAIKLRQEETTAQPLPGFSRNMVNASEYNGEIVAVTNLGDVLVGKYGAYGTETMTLLRPKVPLLVDAVTFEEVGDSLYMGFVSGIFSYRDKKFRHLGFSAAMKDFRIYRDSLILCKAHNGLYVMRNGTRHYFCEGRAHSICLQGDRLWFSDLAGFHYYDIPRDSVHTTRYRVPGNGRVEQILPWGNRLLLLATSNSGVLLLKDGQTVLKQLGMDDGLQNDDCKELDLFAGGLVVRHPLGLSFIEATGNKIHTVSEWEGIPMATVNNVNIHGDSVLLATTRGLFKVGLSSLFRQLPERRKVKFLQVASGEELLLPDHIELGYDANRLRVDFAIPEYDQPGLIQYHWRINDGEWNKTSTTTLELADLKPGDYVLQVKAKAPGYGWSAVSELSFYIRSPFWKTPLFMISAVLAVMVFFLFYQQRWYAKKLATEREKASIRHQLMSYEQKALNAMMNPHFVFNAMGSIQYMLNREHTEDANNYLVKFSRLIRMSLETSQMEFCLVDDEIERLTLYLQLEKMRLGDLMAFTISVDDALDTEHVKIPTLILQTYIENAVIHAFVPHRPLEIHVGFVARGNALVATVEDTGFGFDTRDKSKHSKRFGLNATQKRLELLAQITGKPYRVEIISPAHDGHGTKVVLEFPLVY